MRTGIVQSLPILSLPRKVSNAPGPASHEVAMWGRWK